MNSKEKGGRGERQRRDELLPTRAMSHDLTLDLTLSCHHCRARAARYLLNNWGGAGH